MNRSRYTVYQKTVPDLPPPSKRRKTASPLRHDDDDDDNDAVDDVAAGHGANSSVASSTGMVCSKHPIHIFNDKVSKL